MPFDFGLAKKQLRRTVHDTLRVAAVLTRVGGGVEELQVRFHEKLIRAGQADNFSGVVSEIIEGVDRIVFDNEDLVTRSIVLQRGDRLEIPIYQMSFLLDTQNLDDGAVTITWQVTRQ